MGNGKGVKRSLAVLTSAAILLFGAPAAQAAGSAYEIYTYGSGDFVAQVLVGVALLFSGNVVQSLVKVILLVGLLTVIISPVSSWLSRGGPVGPTGGEGFIAILRQTLLAVLAVYVFILPKADVAIIDRLDPAQNQVVSEVPLVQAIVAHSASLIGDTVGKQMETAFSLPDSMKFQSGGLGLGIKYIDTIFDLQPPSATTNTGGTAMAGAMINESLTEYFNQCVFPEFAQLDGPGDPKSTALYDLMNSGDLLSTLALQSLYADPNITITAPVSGGFTTCDQAIGAIRSAWGDIAPYWISDIEFKLLGYTTVDKTLTGSGALTATILPHYFPGSGLADGSTMLQNIAAGNLLRQAALYYSAQYGDPAMNATNMATNSTVAGWRTTARLFGAVVQTMRNVFEGLVYGLSVLLPVAVAVAGLAPIGTYVKVALWLQLWVPFYVLLNLFADMEMARALSAITQTSAGQITVKTWMDVGEKAQLSLGYVGSLAFTVPMFAWGLLKGGEYAVSSAIGAMVSGGGLAQAGASVGGQVAGMGNVSIGNRNIDSTSARRFTTASSVLAFETGSGNITADRAAASRYTGGSLTEMGREMQETARGVTMGGVTGYGSPDEAYNASRASAEVSVGSGQALDRTATLNNVDVKTEQNILTSQNIGVGMRENTRVAETTGGEKITAADKVGRIGGDVAAERTFRGEAKIEELTKVGPLAEVGGLLGRHEAWNETGKAGAMDNAAAAKSVSTAELYKEQHSVITTGGKNGQETFTVGENGEITSSVTRSGVSSVTDNSHRGISGTSSLVDNTHAAKNGTSSLTDNTHRVVSGTSSLIDNTHKALSGSSSLDENGATVNYGNLMSQAALTGDKSMFEQAAGGRDAIWGDKAHGLKAVEVMAGGLQKYGDLVSSGMTSAQAQASVSASGGFTIPIIETGIKGNMSETLGTTSMNRTNRQEGYSRLMNKYEELANDRSIINDEKNTLLLKEASNIKHQIDITGNKGLVERQVNNSFGSNIRGK